MSGGEQLMLGLFSLILVLIFVGVLIIEIRSDRTSDRAYAKFAAERDAILAERVPRRTGPVHT